MSLTLTSFVRNSPLITLSLHLKGSVVTKGREIIIFVKSQPPFDAHRQCLEVSLRDLQAKVSRFRCRTFTVLLIYRKSSSVFIFKKLSAHDFLAFRVI